MYVSFRQTNTGTDMKDAVFGDKTKNYINPKQYTGRTQIIFKSIDENANRPKHFTSPFLFNSGWSQGCSRASSPTPFCLTSSMFYGPIVYLPSLGSWRQKLTTSRLRLPCLPSRRRWQTTWEVFRCFVKYIFVCRIL